MCACVCDTHTHTYTQLEKTEEKAEGEHLTRSGPRYRGSLVDNELVPLQSEGSSLKKPSGWSLGCWLQGRVHVREIDQASLIR